jgi:hypothetical protein
MVMHLKAPSSKKSVTGMSASAENRRVKTAVFLTQNRAVASAKMQQKKTPDLLRFHRKHLPFFAAMRKKKSACHRR